MRTQVAQAPWSAEMSGSRRAELSANRQFKTLIEPEKLSKQPGPPLDEFIRVGFAHSCAHEELCRMSCSYLSAFRERKCPLLYIDIL